MAAAMTHRLMVVDDSNVIRRRIERANDLPDIDFVGAARNGKEALALHEQVQPTIVTMDLTMPEMDGAECVERLIERDPNIRILVISALSDKLTAMEALEKGAWDSCASPSPTGSSTMRCASSLLNETQAHLK